MGVGVGQLLSRRIDGRRRRMGPGIHDRCSDGRTWIMNRLAIDRRGVSALVNEKFDEFPGCMSSAAPLAMNSMAKPSPEPACVIMSVQPAGGVTADRVGGEIILPGGSRRTRTCRCRRCSAGVRQIDRVVEVGPSAAVPWLHWR